MSEFIVARGSSSDAVPAAHADIQEDIVHAAGGPDNTGEFGAIHPVSIIAKSVSVRVKSKAAEDSEGVRSILNNVSLHVPSGQVMAIMGGSGSGKTTLLNTLAGRPVGTVSGEIQFNGESPRKYHNSGMVAYVTQQDNLLPYVTVRETLRYAARLRLPRTMPLAKKYELVESVILELGLKECADTFVGDEWRKGISGGEKRRVSVGVQLMLNPSVIFMDEPTTGLDSFSARSLIETLVSLAHKRNRTIILSIHQPRSDIFGCFDQIALLARGGRLAYFGSPRGSIRFLDSIGFPVTQDMNGADFIVDAVAIDDRNDAREAETRANVDTIVAAWEQRVAGQHGIEYKVSKSSLAYKAADVVGDSADDSDTVGFNSRVQGAGVVEQISVLSKRMVVNMWEDRLTLWGSVLEVILMGVVIGVIFWLPDQEPTGMYNRKSALYICTAMQNYLGLMFMIYKLTLDMQVFDKERGDKMYSVGAYLVSWISVNFTLYGLLSVLFSIFVYFMCGMRKDDVGYHFGMFCLNSILQQWITMAFSFVCVAFARDFATSSLIGNSVFTFLSLSSGFFIPETAIPVYIRWFEHISYVTYGLRLYISNEFHDHIYECTSLPNIPEARAACDGDNLITATGFTPDIRVPLIGLFSLLAGKIFITAVVLSLFPAGGDKQAGAVSEKKDRKSKTKATPETSLAIEAAHKPPAIALELRDLNLDFEVKRQPLITTSGAPSKTKNILKCVNATFPPGQLTAILGASGAGKSTLLHLLHARSSNLPSHIQAVKTGSILHNSVEFDKTAINACTASVRQDDSHLLPALTARETLVYAALLRLPSAWSKQQKIQRAEEVLVELGLKECANTVVGGDGVKGLSGGEKRRLSVGLAMLMDPSILLLDEPTSGLDASSARNMMITLKGIAAQGRTVICTIHQPRSDIFPLLDRVLLLARGGRVVYQGLGSSMIPYLASLNHNMPFLTNPADFALDISSVDLRSSESETSTRARVDGLIESWKSRVGNEPGSSTVTSDSLTSGEDTVKRVLALSGLKRLSTTNALPILISRSFLNLRRQPGLLAARIMNEVAFGVIFTLYFAKIANNQAGVISRIGLLQQTGSIIFIGMLNCIAVFPQELLLFRFEHQDGTTTVENFFLTYTINELPFEIVGAVIYGLLATYAMGLALHPVHMIIMAFVCVFVGESIGIGFCTLFSKPGFSVQLMSAVISVFSQTQGFLSVNMPSFVNWINYISVLRYMARILAAEEFTSTRMYDCEPGLPCQYPSGDAVLRLLNFPASDRDLMLNYVGLAVCVVMYRVIAYAVMKRQLP
ncbi:P-loop containing nucleoside triphosphate hydrolase protein [Chytriomyces cf. hyalinus JEL632]|nr:P-loop containing nucleoside triphosphate hydrolase protein [Chytriomyces cf. hyalinus JEL632]